MTRQTIGAFLATQRKAHGYTQEEVADKLGISNRTLSKWETDRSSPDILVLPALAQLYGVTVDEILRGERDKPQEAPLPPEAQAEQQERARKARRSLLRRKLSALQARSYIAYGVAAAGFLLLGVAALLTEEVAVLVLAILGAAAYAAAVILLLAFRAGTAAEEDESYRLAARQVIFRALRVVLAAALAEGGAFGCIRMLHMGEGGTFGALLPGAGVLLGAAAFFGIAYAEHAVAARSAEGGAQAASGANARLAKRELFAWCAALALFVASACLSFWHPQTVEALQTGGAQEVTAYLHTLVWTEEDAANSPDCTLDPGEYPLDLSEVGEFTETDVGYGITAMRSPGGVILLLPDQSDGAEGSITTSYAIEADLLGSAGGQAVYNVRFAGGRPYSAIVSNFWTARVGYALYEENGSYTFERRTTYSLENLSVTLGALLPTVAAAAMLLVWALRRKQVHFL